MAHTRKKSSRNKISIILVSCSCLLLALAAFAWYKVYGPNTGNFSEEKYLYIPTGSRYHAVKEILESENFVNDIWSFDLLAKKAGYPDNVKAGRYKIRKGMSNYDLIRMLRAGQQESVKIVIQKIRTPDALIRLLTTKLEPDSMDYISLFADSTFLAGFGLDTQNFLCAILPNTYEFWWNTPASKVFAKLASYYTRFWNEQRLAQAKAKNLTPIDVCILASIVEEETNYRPEMPDIASVYLNRLRKGMKLQADPTAKFAVGDFTLKRITFQHTRLESPYNTYHVFGLPPGPICTPDSRTLEAVLQATETSYLYFCAAPDFSGKHLFATTYAAHMQNARNYHRALRAAGIQ